jgi:hypothetical protein
MVPTTPTTNTKLLIALIKDNAPPFGDASFSLAKMLSRGDYAYAVKEAGKSWHLHAEPLQGVGIAFYLEASQLAVYNSKIDTG